MKKTTSQVIRNIKCNFPILFIAGQPLNEMGAVHALVVQVLDSVIHPVKTYLKVNTVLVSPILIQLMVIYLVESAVARLNNQDQALVVQKLNSAINQINCYPEDKYYENQ